MKVKRVVGLLVILHLTLLTAIMAVGTVVVEAQPAVIQSVPVQQYRAGDTNLYIYEVERDQATNLVCYGTQANPVIGCFLSK